jgi:hypothetical protein
MRLLRVAIIGLLAMLPPSTNAFEPDDTLMRDYIGLTRALQANGVSPVHVPWQPVEAMCLGLRQERHQVPYNRCRFVKAMDSAAYVDNRRDCERLLKGARRQRAEHYAHASYADWNLLRQESYLRCMRDFGWVNPSNWQHGRSAQYAQGY